MYKGPQTVLEMKSLRALFTCGIEIQIWTLIRNRPDALTMMPSFILRILHRHFGINCLKDILELAHLNTQREPLVETHRP